jgi:hypothetical protein
MPTHQKTFNNKQINTHTITKFTVVAVKPSFVIARRAVVR